MTDERDMALALAELEKRVARLETLWTLTHQFQAELTNSVAESLERVVAVLERATHEGGIQ